MPPHLTTIIKLWACPSYIMPHPLTRWSAPHPPNPPAGATTRRFLGHSKDVLSVAFSADNRQIVSGSRDKTIKLWNTLGEATGVLGCAGLKQWVDGWAAARRAVPQLRTASLASCLYTGAISSTPIVHSSPFAFPQASASTPLASPTATPSGCPASASPP